MGVHQPLPQSCNNLKTHLPLTFQLCGADSMKHASLSLRLVGRWGWKILVPIGHWTPCPHHFTLHLLNIVCWRLPISPPTNFCYIYDDWKPTWGISFLLLFLFYFILFFVVTLNLQKLFKKMGLTNSTHDKTCGTYLTSNFFTARDYQFDLVYLIHGIGSRVVY